MQLRVIPRLQSALGAMERKNEELSARMASQADLIADLTRRSQRHAKELQVRFGSVVE